MLNNIRNKNYKYLQYFPSKQSNVSFTGNPYVETLKHYNIGIMAQGYIGKIRVKTAENADAFLNVFKSFETDKWERYSIKDDADRLIGEIKMEVRKYHDYDRLHYPTDPSHVFGDGLRNYSRPDTPYYNPELPYYKYIGTRLLQILQRRSDESQCYGNIKLVAINETMNKFYKKVGFKQEFPPIMNQKVKIFVNNPYQLYLPPEAKEPFSQLHGGL